MREFLVFRLWAPMASWGDIAVGERRGSWSRPSRSGVLGLVAAALGIERSNAVAHTELEEGLGFAVRVDDPGQPLRDFHTAEFPVRAALKDVPSGVTRQDHVHAMENFNRTAPKSARGNPILSERQYYVEMDALIALWSRDGKALSRTLAEIGHALAEPVFTLYAGRKSCPPGLPLAPRVVSAETPLVAFSVHDERSADERTAGPDLSWGRWRYRLPASEVWLSEDDARAFALPTPWLERTSRRDGIRDRDRWLFSDRAEVRIAVPPAAEAAKPEAAT